MALAPPENMPAVPDDARKLLRRLEERHVEHVLCGPIAAAVYGCALDDPTPVIVPARFERNIDRLATVLREVGARWREAGGGALPVDLTPARLRTLGRWPLLTALGPMDIDFEPPATAGHLDLFGNARRFALPGVPAVEIAAPADLIRIAEMRRTPADEAALPVLRAALPRAPALLAGD